MSHFFRTHTRHWVRQLYRGCLRHFYLGKARQNLTIQSSTINAKTPNRIIIDRFGSLLPFGYEVEKGIFTITAPESDETEALGYVLEISPQTGASEELAKHLESLLSSDMPAGSGIQVSLFASPDIDWATQAYYFSRTPACVLPSSYHDQAQTLQALAQERIRYLKKGTHGADSFRLRHFRAWVSVTVPTHSHFREDLFVQISKVKKLRDRHITALKTFHLYESIWGADCLKKTLQQLTNPQHYFLEENNKEALLSAQTFSASNPHDPLAHQLVLRDTHIRIDDEGIEFSQFRNAQPRKIRAIGLSVQGYPSDYALPLVKTWLGSEKENIPCPFLLTSAIHFPDYEKTKTHANLMAARSKQIAASEVAQFLPSLKKRAHDYDLSLIHI